MQSGLLVLVVREWVLITGLSSKRMGPDLWSQKEQENGSRSLVSQNAAVPSLHVPIVIDEFCLPVKLSPRCSLLAASWNVATSQPRHRVFACLCMAPEDLGDATM